MANWIKGKAPDRFDGCLVILNIGQQNYSKVDSKYLGQLESHISDAIAMGHMILYLFDKETGGQPQPEIFDQAEGISNIRMLATITTRTDANFKLMPKERMAEFKALAEEIRGNEDFQFKGPTFICGSCKIDGMPVLLPKTEIER